MNYMVYYYYEEHTDWFEPPLPLKEAVMQMVQLLKEWEVSELDQSLELYPVDEEGMRCGECIVSWEFNGVTNENETPDVV